MGAGGAVPQPVDRSAVAGQRRDRPPRPHLGQRQVDVVQVAPGGVGGEIGGGDRLAADHAAAYYGRCPDGGYYDSSGRYWYWDPEAGRYVPCQ